MPHIEINHSIIRRFSFWISSQLFWSCSYLILNWYKKNLTFTTIWLNFTDAAQLKVFKKVKWDRAWKLLHSSLLFSSSLFFPSVISLCLRWTTLHQCSARWPPALHLVCMLAGLGLYYWNYQRCQNKRQKYCPWSLYEAKRLMEWIVNIMENFEKLGKCSLIKLLVFQHRDGKTYSSTNSAEEINLKRLVMNKWGEQALPW